MAHPALAELSLADKNSYESISIDKMLMNEVRKYIVEFHGYRSPSEFVHEAIRLKLIELEKIRLAKKRLDGKSRGK